MSPISLKNCVVLMSGDNVQHRSSSLWMRPDVETGNYSREKGTAMVNCKVTVAVFGDLFPSPKVERTIEALMAEEPVALRAQ